MESPSNNQAPVNQVPCIPTHSSASTSLRCCCGRDDCAFLSHNNVALEGLEKDLATAAKLGQALLHRHESYMAEAEEDRHHLFVSIESLEREKRQVQEENARIIEENRGLLVQLEELNRAVADSDSRAKSLAAHLESTEVELRKVTASAARAADLEAQLASMEAEQSKLQDNLLFAQEGSKSAVQRWKQAETTLRNLHDQVDQIEKEAREERERHTDLIQRMERRRAVERELDGAAGRLKGAAAAQELSRNQGGTVVSHFVKDILQDNANLQMGIMELREMLESSNQEVQNLREQILSHQPLASTGEGDGDQEHQTTTLCQELASQESRQVSQEFHIHHHYHTPPVPVGSKKERATLLRRSRKRRSLGSPSTLHSASGTQLSRKSRHRSQSSASSTSTILSQTSVSIPPSWPLQSPVTDSLASSPQSLYRSSAIFDRVDRGFESSRATSPESSTMLLSPLRGTRSRKGAFDGSFQSLDAELSSDLPNCTGEGDGYDEDVFVDYHEYPFEDSAVQSVILEEREDSVQHATSEHASSPPMDDDVFTTPYRPMRRASHESLFSVAGMDIHTSSHHPSRMSDFGTPLPIRIPRRIVSTSSQQFSRPVIATTPITADREPSKINQSPRLLLASMAASSVPDSSSIDSDSDTTIIQSRTASLTRRVGGWVRGRWGTAPMSSDGHLQPPNDEPASSASSVSSVSADSPRAHTQKFQPQANTNLRFRYPGVNQSGPIMGFRPTPRAPARIHAENVDEGLLRESLAE
ncbi:hypothetical protein FE257_011441 [Aspergillus nanangensis]|uniref:Uncharacterized protein n=1 Tax=Aspergillus nanangensis TaxID=2582783 RepID=A0AAD4GQJ8_ASPNN|nr:hypothetical protein FE257_011441 [Aspergillus nanangensis]